MTNSKIRKGNEETACDYCGTPLYVGDTVVYVLSNAYCSVECSDLHGLQIEAREAAMNERKILEAKHNA